MQSSLTPVGKDEARRVSRNGGIRWNARWVNVSHVLAELPVGLEPITDGTRHVLFGPAATGPSQLTAACRIQESTSLRRPPGRQVRSLVGALELLVKSDLLRRVLATALQPTPVASCRGNVHNHPALRFSRFRLL